MKLTNRNILILRAALHALEGREKAIETKGQMQVIVKPFKFSGRTRLKIARNLRAVDAAFADYDAARVGLVRELAAEGEDKVAEGKLAEFSHRHEELLKEKSDVVLTPLVESDLNLDDNDIPHGALAALLDHLIGELPSRDNEN